MTALISSTLILGVGGGHDRKESITLDYLGHILWFTIGEDPTQESRITRDQLVSWFTDGGLDTSVLPDPVRPIDAFRAASSGVERKYTVDRTEYTLTTNEVSSDKQQVLRQVVRHHRTASGRLIEAKVAELKFIRPVRTARGIKAGTEMWRYAVSSTAAPAGTEHRRQVDDLINTFSIRYVNHEKYVPVAAQRKIVRDTLANLSALLLKPSGGMYFVVLDHVEEVAALQAIVRRLGTACTFHSLPLINDLEQRAMINEALAADMRRDSTRLVTRAKALPDGAEDERIREIEADLADLLARTETHARYLPDLDQGELADLYERTSQQIDEVISNRRSRLEQKRHPKRATRRPQQ